MTDLDLPTTALHVFATGAWDLLVGAAALSVVVALVSIAVEQYLRPRAQQIITSHWARQIRWMNEIERNPERPPHASDDSVFSFATKLPRAIYALPAEQLCAQINRRLQSAAETFEARRHNRSDSPPRELSPSYWEEECETHIDELQSTLLRAAMLRSYALSIGTVFVLNALLLGGALGRVGVSAAEVTLKSNAAEWSVTVILFTLVAVLLGPIFQGVITKFLRLS